jgi:hypothetical protein
MKNRLWILAVLSLILTAGGVSAQTKRKKTQPARTIPVTTQQIIEQSQPEIINPEIQTPIEMQTENIVEDIEDGQIVSDNPSFQAKIDEFNNRIKEISSRLGSLESSRRGELDDKQRRLLLNLEILSRAEQRAESLRQKAFELTEKESSIRARLDQLEFESSEEAINRSVAFVGGMRPEVLREQRRKAIENEKSNLNNLLLQIQRNRANLDENILKADAMVERLRLKLEKEIDDALNEIDQ